MLKARDWRQWRTRDHLLVFGPALLLAIAAFVVGNHFRQAGAAAPHRAGHQPGRTARIISMASATQAELAREGITVELRATAGSVENVRLLADPAGDVDVAFVQGGVRASAPDAELLSLGSLYFEPLWILSRAGGLPRTCGRSGQAAGRRARGERNPRARRAAAERERHPARLR